MFGLEDLLSVRSVWLGVMALGLSGFGGLFDNFSLKQMLKI